LVIPIPVFHHTLNALVIWAEDCCNISNTRAVDSKQMKQEGFTNENENENDNFGP